MDNQCEKIDYLSVAESFFIDLAKIANSKASLGHDSVGFIAHELYLKGQSFWTEAMIDSLIPVTEGRNAIKLNGGKFSLILGFDFSSGGSARGSLCLLVISLFSSAALKKLLILPSYANLAYLFKDPDLLLKNHKLKNYFSTLVIELLNVRTRRRFDCVRELLSLDWTGLDKLHTQSSKTWQKSTGDVARFAFIYGINEFKDIKVSDLNDFRFNVRLEGKGAISLQPTLRFFDGKLGTDIAGEYSKFANEVQFNTANLKEKDLTPSAATHSGYRSLVKKSALDMAGSFVSNKAIVLVPTAAYKEIRLDTYAFSLSSLSDYHAADMNKDSLWIQSQKDYIKSNRAELGTIKSRASALRYFNVYLFSYLPYFFENIKTCFKYPENPEDFQASIFTEYSEVVNRHLKCDESLKIYPYPLVDFIIKFSEEQKNNSTNKSNNLGRDVLRTITGYFDYLISSYSQLKGFKILKNPLSNKAPRLGTAYNKSSKSKFEFYYWLYLRAYMKEVTKSLLYISANQIAVKLKEIGEYDKYERALSLAEKIKASRQDTDPLWDSYAVNKDDIFINGRVEFSDELPPLNIEHIDLSGFTTHKTLLTSGGLYAQTCDYKTFLHCTTCLYSAQRYSNIHWLDSDSFDQDYVEKKGQSKDSLVPLYTETDKINVDGIDTQVPLEIMELLQFARELRSFNVAPFITDGIYYQNNENSVFGKLKPLLQTNIRHANNNYNLGSFLIEFEGSIKKSSSAAEFNKLFGSHLFNSHRHINPTDFLFYKKFDRVPTESICKIQNNPDEDFLLFTPVCLKTTNTIHSARKQLVSVISALTPDREAVRMFTGQADATIGYYADNNVDELKEIKDFEDKYGVNILGVKESQIDEKSVMASIIAGTLHKDYPSFTSAPSGEMTSGIADLNTASTDEVVFNWTHICPHGNKCPTDVIRQVGERNCHICCKAIMDKHNASAIGAKIRQLLDDVCDLDRKMNHEQYTEQDKSDLMYERQEKVLKASSWKVRLDFINENGGMLVGNKTSVIDNMKYIPPGSVKHSLYCRLKETENVPALQSNQLKAIASRISRKLIVSLSEIDKDIERDFEIKMDYDPVGFALNNLKIMADLQGVTVIDLLENHKPLRQDKSMLELFE